MRNARTTALQAVPTVIEASEPTNFRTSIAPSTKSLDEKTPRHHHEYFEYYKPYAKLHYIEATITRKSPTQDT